MATKKKVTKKKVTKKAAPKKKKAVKAKGFKVGDRVKISEESDFFDVSPYNPGGKEGTVYSTEVRGGNDPAFKYQVAWDNGYNNDYRPQDLVRA